jgi:ubiquinol-cytochrome c reductase cytochrome c subunit
MQKLKRKLNGLRRSPRSVIAVLFAGLIVVGSGYTAVNASVSSERTVEYTKEDIEYGKKLFLSNCASCHGKNAEGTANGPSLIGVGAASVDFQVSTGRKPAALNFR